MFLCQRRAEEIIYICLHRIYQSNFFFQFSPLIIEPLLCFHELLLFGL